MRGHLWRTAQGGAGSGSGGGWGRGGGPRPQHGLLGPALSPRTLPALLPEGARAELQVVLPAWAGRRVLGCREPLPSPLKAREPCSHAEGLGVPHWLPRVCSSVSALNPWDQGGRSEDPRPWLACLELMSRGGGSVEFLITFLPHTWWLDPVWEPCMPCVASGCTHDHLCKQDPSAGSWHPPQPYMSGSWFHRALPAHGAGLAGPLSRHPVSEPQSVWVWPPCWLDQRSCWKTRSQSSSGMES